MKKILFLLLITSTSVSFSQQAIGTNAPDASAALDVTSTNKGVLIPRIALTGTNDVTTITIPQTSLLVYNTATVVGANAITPGFHYFDGTSWIFLRDAKQGNDSTSDFWIDSTYVRGGNTIMQIRDNGNVEIGLSNKIEITNRQISSGGTGLRELFRVPNNKLATSGIFSIASTRANFVHSSNWSWTSNHQATGRGMLTKLSGSDYFNNTTGTNIPVYIDVASNGDAIISADWSGAQNIDISILKLSGRSVDLTNTGTLWSSPNVGYIRADSVFTREHAFQTRDALFSGNVGVGTTNPTSKLHVYDTINSNTAVRVDAGKKVARFSATALDSSDNYIGLEMGVVGANDATFSYYGQPERAFIYSSASANGLNIISQLGKSDERIAFYSGKNANANPDMVIAPSGNVGIGTTTPTEKIHILNDIGDTRIKLVADPANSGIGEGWNPGITMEQDGSLIKSYIGYVQALPGNKSDGVILRDTVVDVKQGNPLLILSNDYSPSTNTSSIQLGTNDTIAMTVAENRNVGIGTITPSRKLEVAGDINVGLNITPLVANSYGNRLYFGGNAQNTDDLWMARYNRLSDQTYLRVNIGDNTGGGEDAFQIGNGTFATPFLHVNNLGRVGIGTTTPTEKLHVNGEARIQTITDTTSAIHVLTSNANGVIKKIRVDSIVNTSGGSSGWALTGNAGTTAGTNFIGTTDNQALSFRVNNTEKFRIERNGVLSTLNVNRSVFLGEDAGINYDFASDANVFIGYRAGRRIDFGGQNVFIGFESGESSDLTTSRNTGVGYQSLKSNRGDRNTSLGYNSFSSLNTFVNSTALGANTTITSSNKVRLGDASVTVIEGQVAYSFPSDGRFKTNIKEEEVKGLDFILNLRPVVYNFDTKKFDEFLLQTLDDSTKNEIIKSKDYTESTAIRQSGFIAQEVEEAAEKAGYNFNGIHKPSSKLDNYSLAYSQFVVPLVKSTQEQQAIIKSQEERIDKLEKELQEIKALLLNKTDK